MDKLFLIDGHALMYRMYYAFINRHIVNTKGTDTSVLFGFVKYLLELIRKESPTHLGVAFDPPCKTFRHDAYDQYKANRPPAPEVIKNSFDPLVDIIKSLGIPILMVPGYEADDVIGAMAKKSEKEGCQVFMVTPDKDFGQLVSDNIIQFKPGKSGTDNEYLGKKEICEKYNIKDPKEVIDILAIWGDAVDNVPGVRGVGEIGAKKLVSTYGSVENILAHLDSLPPKQAEAFMESKERLEMSKFLVTIKTDIALDFTEKDLRVDFSDTSRTLELFSKYELNSLVALLPSTTATNSSKKVQASIPQHRASISEITEAAKDLSIALKILPDASKIYIACRDYIFETPDFIQVKSLLEDNRIKKTGYDIKRYINILRDRNISLNGPLFDIELLHYLLNPEVTHHLDILAKSYLDIDIESAAVPTQEEPQVEELDLFSSHSAADNNTSSPVDHSPKERIETLILLPLSEAILSKVSQETGLWDLYTKMEMPLIRILADMEYQGFKIDTLKLAEYGEELNKELSVIEERIRNEAGDPNLNVSSPMQLGVIIFDKLQLDPKAKKNARGNYSTDEETLVELADRHPIINDILLFREVKKMISTYIEPLPSLISPKDGRIHTTFNQALTATGRLSSARPNLQNIPVRSEMGRKIRESFIPSSPDKVIISADYSQIELRLMAAISADPDMINAFRHSEDIHAATAAKIFKIPIEEVTKEQRRKAKVANFGIIYGISSFGLSQRLRIPRKESKELIEEYFRSYPGVLAYMEKMKNQAREKGYVETLFHRKRYLPNISSKNYIVRSVAERNAINAPIQGTAADIIKLAMIRVSDRFAAEKISAKMILQVHDELVFDTPKEEIAKVKTIVKEEMEGVIDLGFPLTVECSEGDNWLEAH